MSLSSFLKLGKSARLFCGCTCLLILFSGAVQPLRSEITVVSYHLRDRAVVLDSLVMRKRMIFSFKSSRPLSELAGGTVVGAVSHEGRTMARDTAYIFDETAGNLGFALPYEIPEGTYRLEISIIAKNATLLESYSGDFDREELRPYFRRGINFWDFTEPYAHLQCSGHGELTYRFQSEKTVKPRRLEIWARMMSDNRFPVLAKVSLNGVEIGRFELPAADNKAPKVVVWRAQSAGIPAGVAVRPGENRLSFSIPRDINPRGMGIRIYAHRNSSDPALEEGIPISLRLVPADKESGETVFQIPVWGEEGEHITTRFITPEPAGFTEEIIEAEQEPFPLKEQDIRRGYVVFSRPYLCYVYPWTIPARDEKVDSLGLRLARSDFEPLTFSLYPVRELGRVRVSVGELKGPQGGVISSDKVQIHLAKPVKVRTGGTGYRLVPRMLERTDRACIPLDYSTRFWLTIHADSGLAPGLYRGAVRIEPEKEQSVEIALSVEVLPITLEPVPGIAYSMFMSYEFFELESKNWTDDQREKIYRDGVNVFRDFKNHGITTVDVSSPYYFQWNSDRTPRMEHFKGMITGAKEAGFPGPVFWYFAHYVQAAKSQHPGSVLIYDPQVHPKRAGFLVETAQKLSRELGGPPVCYVPIDEPRIASRQKITMDLLKAVKKVRGVRTMSSTDIGGKLLDIENNSSRHRKKLGPGEYRRTSDREVWEYHNAVITCLNPGYSRYIYGYYTWRQDLDGMNSWGFNTAENSRGHPYEDLDHRYSDWNLAYPHPGAPLPTPNWEALREGIEDVRYVYQLEKLVRQKRSAHPEQAEQAEKFLDEIRGRCDLDERLMINDFGPWTPEAFDSLRVRVVEWILKFKDL